MTTFKQLGLSKEILQVLIELGFEQPTAIQEQAIPILLNEGKDFIGLAQTGTGKTAAFGLPLLEQVDPHLEATQALVLAPTRELGRQIAEQLSTFSKYLDKVNVLPVYGGAAIYNQIRALKRTQHIIIATPGRLIDLIKRKAVKLDQLRMLVLDEADEMLNMGFKEELDEILSFTPADKLTWLFSATMPPPIKKIVSRYMDDPKEVRINAKEKVNTNIEHQFTTVRQSDKTEALTRFMDINPGMRGVVFCRTKRDTQFLAERLLKKNYKADALHGDLSQHQRDRVMGRFKNHDLQVLIATDVAARGIDVNDLTHVFHFSLPDDMAYYTHRSGRTARAGKKGISISFISGSEFYKIRGLERQLGISFKKVFIPSAQDIAEIRITHWCEELLKQKTKGRIDPKLMDRANRILEKLTREAIISKLISAELEKLDLGSEKELNDASRGRSDESREGRRGASRTKNKYKPTQSWNFSKKRKDAKGKKKKKGKKKRY